jgi:hypothetical protein
LTVVKLFESTDKIRAPEIHLPLGGQIRQVADVQGRLADAPAIAYALNRLYERLLVMTMCDNSVPHLVVHCDTFGF